MNVETHNRAAWDRNVTQGNHLRRLFQIPVITLSLAALLVSPACNKKKKKERPDACGPAVKRTKQYLGALCKAWRSLPRTRHKRLDHLHLAQADLPLVKTLPDAPLAVLGPGWLVVENNIVERWSSHWRKSKAAKPAPKKRASTPGADALAKAQARSGKRSVKDTGVLAMLSRATKNRKQKSLFDPDSVAERLARELRKHHRSNGRAELLLAIAVNTPMKQVVSFVDLAQRSGYKHVGFLLSPSKRPHVPSGPPGEPVRARLAKTPGRAWSKPNIIAVERVAKHWRAKRCAEVYQLLDSLQKADGTTDCDRLAANVQQAITACRCVVDERPLLRLVRRWIGPFVFIAIHRVTLSSKAKPVKVTDGSLPWSKLLGSVLKMNARAFRLSGFTLETQTPIPRRP